jgi:hypothetical protein
MERHVFYAKQSLDPQVVKAAKATATSLGARVVRTGMGTMLLEAKPELVRKLVKALPGWGHNIETTSRRPEQPRLGRRPTTKRVSVAG